MKRILIILFAAALLLVSGAPPLIGGLIQAHQQHLLERLSLVVAGSEPVIDSYEKGWFTSRTRHRLLLSDERFITVAQMLADPGESGTPAALIIDTVVAHGPWPMLEGWPALARMRSTLFFESADGELTALPVVAVTRIGFGGGGYTRVTADELLKPMVNSQGVFSFGGADISIAFDRNAARLESSGVVGPVKVEGVNGLMQSGRLTFSSDTRPTGFGFRSGSSQVAMESFVFVDYLGREVSGSGFELALEVSADDTTADYAAHVDMARIQAQGGAPVAIDLDLYLEALDGVMFGTLLQRVEQGFELRGLGTELASLVRPGSGLRVSRLNLGVGDGHALLELELQVPEAEVRPIRDGAELLSVIEGEGQLRVNRLMLNNALGVNPGAPGYAAGAGDADPIGLISQGYLRVVGEELVSDLRISGGLITVNKLPLPLSMAR